MRRFRVAIRRMLLLPALAALGGCAMVTITSEPSGAEITCSRTGQAPWKPWPPGAAKPALTPARRPIRSDPYYFVRVQKEGYHPVQPVFLDAGPMRRQRAQFQLEPTPELFARRQQERGLVLFEGRWVEPKKQGLVEYQGKWMRPAEKQRLEMQARGMVFYEPQARWMTPKQIEALEAKQKQDQGLVFYKGQWMKPFQADLQKLVDERAEKTAASSATFELRIERIGPVFTAGAELRITDLAGHPLEVLLSGPESHLAYVLPYNSMTTQTLPGNYLLVVRQADSRTGVAAVARVRLEAKSRYSATYRGVPVVRPKSFVLPRPGEIRIEPPPAGPPVSIESVIPREEREGKK